MAKKPIVIFGAGGFAREVLALLRDVNRQSEMWDVQGFVDDNERLWGNQICNLPVFGGSDWLASRNHNISVAIGVGNPTTRKAISDSLERYRCDFPTLVHPSVVISDFVQLGQGTIVTAGNILTSQIELGDFVLLNLSCTIGHDTNIGAFSTLSPGINVSGNVQIGTGCDIGTGAALIPGVCVGDWSIIGAGAVVTGDLPDNCTAVGVPARVIKQREPGWQLR